MRVSKPKVNAVKKAIDDLIGSMPNSSLYIVLDDGKTYSALDGCKLVIINEDESDSSATSLPDLLKEGKVILTFSTPSE